MRAPAGVVKLSSSTTYWRSSNASSKASSKASAAAAQSPLPLLRILPWTEKVSREFCHTGRIGFYATAEENFGKLQDALLRISSMTNSFQ